MTSTQLKLFKTLDIKSMMLDSEVIKTSCLDPKDQKGPNSEHSYFQEPEMIDVDSIKLELPQELNQIFTEIWDTFLISDCAKPIACTKEESETWMGWSRDNELTSFDNLDEADDSTDSFKMSPEQEEILDRYLPACFSILTDEDFPLNNQLFQDVAVETIPTRGNGLVSEYEQHSPTLEENMSETLQPLDFSVTSKMLEKTAFQHPSLDDLPELKPCPIMAAENAKCAAYMEEAVNLTMYKDVQIKEEISEKKERKIIKRKRKRKKLNDLPDDLLELSSPDVKPLILTTDIHKNSEILLRLEKGPQTVPTNGRLEAPQAPTTNDLSTTPPLPGQNGDRVESPPQGREVKRPGRRPGQRKKPPQKIIPSYSSRVYHLWEFLRDLLLNETYCPSHIHWIDKLNGVFRIAKSEDVARLWGQRKRTKRNMTYEKMSRAIRFSRAAGYFGNLPKEGNYPKKLCFKFGPRCQDWIVQSKSCDIPARPPKQVSSAVDSKVEKATKIIGFDKNFPLKKRKYTFST